MTSIRAASRSKNVVREVFEVHSPSVRDQLTALHLVETTEDIRTSLHTFIASPTDRPSMRKLARGTSYWLHDPTSHGFCPAKFVGYIGMTLGRYEQAKLGNFEGERFDGHTTRTQIEAVMGSAFSPSADLSQELLEWGAALFGADIFEGIDVTKWRFLSVPEGSSQDTGRDRIAKQRQASARRTRAIGERYRPANEEIAVDTRDPFEVDPEVIERGTRGHAVTQNALASFLVAADIQPLSPTIGDPDFDIAWIRDGALYVAEVKSITNVNEDKQLRLGLGQVLWYRHRLAEERELVNAVLVVEREPTDDRWLHACADARVALVWPGEFGRLLQPAPW
jgi:hypothetical protein